MTKILFAMALALASVPFSSAHAGSVDMTCAQAKNHYNRNGRIYVRTNGGDIVPIYGLVQSCRVGYTRSPYWVRTYDNDTCVLGYRCRRNGGRGR